MIALLKLKRPAYKVRSSLSYTVFKYIFGETFFSFFVSFLFFFFIFFVNQLLLMAREILSKKVPFDQVALLVLYAIPSIIAMSAPFATLLGTLITIGRFTSDNEILVLLTSGLSYKNIFAPTLLVGVIVSFISFGANDILLPMGTIEFTRLYRRILASTPALEIEANSVKKFKDTVVVTGNVSGNKIDDMVILDKTSDGERRVIISKTAEFIDAGAEGLRLDLDDAFVHSTKEVSRENYDYIKSDVLRYRIKQDDLITGGQTISAREMSLRDVFKVIQDKEDAVHTTANIRNVEVLVNALELENIIRRGPENRDWRQREAQLSAFKREYNIAHTIINDRTLLIFRLEFYKKLSIPFGSFAFIFLAVPLGLLAKKSGQAVGFVLGILIALVYWSLLLGGQNMGLKLGTSPFWSMWLPNILTLVIGLIMCLFRVRK
ncbi:MAG: LptF/LptG family permease [Spirochaetaceae bacterium]|jgi:lipopolysaccharide export system permease protein|nr:LptF/LptG family permease [Spirochaetaceae bacterium]